MNTPRSLIRPYYPGLHGLRGLAVLLIFADHYGAFVVQNGVTDFMWVGVDLFFVLSGFLITGILYDSKGDPHFFRNFYTRRALRIFPLYYTFFLAVALLTPVLHLEYDRILWSNLLYLQDFTMVHLAAHNPAVILIPHGIRHMSLDLGPLWSLSVEEQFYLTWPFILWSLPSRKTMMHFCLAGILVVTCIRIFLLFHDPSKVAETRYLYYSIYTRADTLLIGSWLALWLRGTHFTIREVRKIGHSLILAAGGILTLSMLTIGRHWPVSEVNPVICSFGYTLIALVAVGLMLLALDETSIFHRFMKAKFLATMGTISYGFYFFHNMFWPEFNWINQRIGPKHLGPLTVFLAFTFSFTIAWVSFHYFESPFLKLKKYFAPGHRSVPSGSEEVL